MRSFLDIDQTLAGIPAELVTLLASVEYGRGREELFRVQAPQVLQRLAARTRFDSITASSAMENVVVDDDRALKLLREPAAAGAYRDRSEAEFAGYRDATDELLRKQSEPLTVPLVLHIHRALMRHTGDPLAGRLKTSDNVIGDLSPDRHLTVVFEPVAAGPETERQLVELVGRYEQALSDTRLPPVLLLGALILDFLAIHPFQDGNGRVARLLTANELLRHGFAVTRYVSIEQHVFETKHSYYSALRASQANWHEGGHDVWPWIGYLLRVLSDAYSDFESRVAAGTALVGATKEEQARNYILTQAPRSFRISQIVDALPDISQATIRNALDRLKLEGRLAVGRGRSARWTRTDEAARGAHGSD